VRRREFITLLGGAAAAWPFAANAQQGARVPRIGIVDDAPMWQSFRQALREFGYVEGQSVNYEYRYSEGVPDRLAAAVGELVRRPVDLIAIYATPATEAAKAATTTIPIVFIAAEDPVKLGLVASLARPGGNLTGINFLTGEVVAKRLELMRELVPTAARVAVLVNPTNAADTETTARDVAAAARAIGLQIQTLNASTVREINAAFATFVRERPDAVFVGLDPFFNSRRIQLVQLAARYAIPASYPARDFAEAGGLMSYGADIADAWRQAGSYAGRILKGAKVADLPVVQATKFELVFNVQTATMLGLTVPDKLLVAADEVIE
jgi:putative ABC transport system substrate-binding protein